MIEEATMTATVVTAQRKTKCLIQRNYRFFIAPNTGEKQLANRPMHSKRIEIINTIQSVPKKNKIVQSKNQPPPEAGGSPAEVKIDKATARGASTKPRRGLFGRKKIATVAKAKVSMPS